MSTKRREGLNEGPEPVWLDRLSWLLVLGTFPGGCLIPGFCVGPLLMPPPNAATGQAPSMLPMAIAGIVFPVLMLGAVWYVARAAQAAQERRLADSGKPRKAVLIAGAIAMCIASTIWSFAAVSAVEELRFDHTGKSTEELVALLGDQDERMRESAAHWIAWEGSAESCGALLKELESPNTNRRLAAEQGLYWARSVPVSLVPDIVACYGRLQTPTGLKTLERVLAQMGPPGARALGAVVDAGGPDAETATGLLVTLENRR